MIDKNKKLIVLMPPKTASTSTTWMLENLGYVFSLKTKIVYPRSHMKLSEILDMYNVNNFDEYKVMQIVRNPYHRFVSAFYFYKKIIPIDYNPTFKNYNFLDFSNHLYQSKKTDNFVKNFYGDELYVNRCIRNGISWGGTRLHDTQLSWDDVGVDVKYFKMETLSSDVSELESYLETPIKKFPRLNSQNLQNYKSLITPEIKQIVTELFDEDFNKFDYIK
jgi:hypothetical protein